MAKKVLIITSVSTGSGHKSVSDSLYEQFSVMPDVEVKVIDGFDLAGRFAHKASRIYGSLIRHTPWIYNGIWKMTDARPTHMTTLSWLCRRPFLECVKNFKPDIILTVHSFFNSLITDILKKNNLDIPVVVVQADLVSIHSTWCNPEAYRTICPTQEAFECNLAHRMPADKLKILSFPARGRFVQAARASHHEDYDPANPLKILLMSGGEGGAGLKEYAEMILRDPHVRLTIICGRNHKLQDKLQKEFGTVFANQVRVLGFVNDIEYEMLRNDLLIARGSPNTLTEAVTLGVPIIMTGPILEQERGNFTLAQEKNLGLVCLKVDDILPLIRSLVINDGEGLKKMREAQEQYRDLDSALNIATYSLELLNN